jgi:hypothetical protein
MPAFAGFKIRRRGIQTEHTMKTHDRKPPSVREYIAENTPKTAKEIQNEINFMRAAYQRQLDRQDGRDAMVGWCLLALALIAPVIVVIAILW